MSAPKSILNTKLWIQEAIELVLQHSGTYYLPYQAFATIEQFNQTYPGVKNFITKKRMIDPNNVFSTGFSQNYFCIESKSN